LSIGRRRPFTFRRWQEQLVKIEHELFAASQDRTRASSDGFLSHCHSKSENPLDSY
jgi:hypothetical protein